VGERLHKVAMGYHRYHAVPGNLDRLRVFGQRLRCLWRLVLSRRSQRGMLPWDRLTPIFARWISGTRVLHPDPRERFVASNGRPYRVPFGGVQSNRQTGSPASGFRGADESVTR
jgi:hypothetical protein